MRALNLTTDDYDHLLRTLLDTQHLFHALNRSEVTTEGDSYTFEAGGLTKAMERSLNIIGWRAGDPTPAGISFERLSPHPLEPIEPGEPPTADQITQACIVLMEARKEGGLVDVLKGQGLNDQELAAAAARFNVSPEELLDCVLNVGNSVAVLAEFLRIR